MTDDQMPERFADDAHRFRLDSRIATGGMGEVWRASDTVLGRKVAVKLLKAEYADDATFRSRFETEARHAAALHHPGIAGVFDVGSASAADGSGHPRPFLVMELVEGQPLSALLTKGRDLDPDAVRDLLAQVGEALGVAHQAGIVHRDVKPANLIVTPEGKVKVTDFGIARAADGVGITRTGAVMGTPQYLSPEQAEGKPATARSDVYALGVVAFECLAGRRPFESESAVATALAHIREPVPELPARIPRDLAAVVRRSLDKDPAARYADGAAFAAALRDPATSAVPKPAPRVVPVPAPAPAPESATQVLPAFSEPEPDPTPMPVPTPVAAPASSPSSDRESGWPIGIAVLLLVALAIVVTLLVTRGGDDDQTATDTDTGRDRSSQTSEPTKTSDTPSETSTTPAEPDPISLNPGEFTGQPVDRAVAALQAQGFTDVAKQSEPNDDPSADGLVTDVVPSSAGDYPPDTKITVFYAEDAPEPPPSSDPPSSDPATSPTDPASSPAEGEIP